MSIVTQKINTRPRLTNYLVARGELRNSPLRVVDVGARGGFEKHWSIYKDQVDLIGFELDREECIRLNKLEKNTHRTYYPIALHEKEGKKKFYIQPHLASSSFYKSDKRFLERFPASKGMIPTKTVMIPTVGLDSFIKEHSIKGLDFIKLDVEGAELDIFKGATGALKNSILGLSAEAVFFPWRHNIPTFTDIDIFLKPYGFVLFDLPIMKWERRPLSPYMFEDKGVFGPTDRGQPVWTQAIYLKDGVNEMHSSKAKRKWWNRNRILKMASIMELFNLEDCAIELIEEALAMEIVGAAEARSMIDLLTPRLNGRDVNYKKYVEYLKLEGPPRYIDGKRVSQKEFEKYKTKKR